MNVSNSLSVQQNSFATTKPDLIRSFFSDQIHFKTKGIASSLYSASNKVLDLINPLMSDRSFMVVSGSKLVQQPNSTEKKLYKTILAVILFLPSLALGGLLRLSAFAIDKDICEMHKKIVAGDFSLIGKDVFSGPSGGKYNPDFFESINTNQPDPTYVTPEWVQKQNDHQNWDQIQKNYAMFCSRVKAADSEHPNPTEIEQNINFIWVKPPNKKGSPLPQDAAEVVESWKKHHPETSGWKVKVWNDADLEPLIEEVGKKFPNVKEAWEKAGSAAEKADIARLVVLWEKGGLYVDTDLPCVGPVDDLHALSKGCYFSMECNEPPPQHNRQEGSFYIGNAQLAARSRHPIIELALKKVRCAKPKEDYFSIYERTGPTLATRTVYEALKTEYKDQVLVLPPTYFYVWHISQRDKGRAFGYSRALPWTKGIHLWAGKWG